MLATPARSNRDSSVREVTSSAMDILSGAKRKPKGSEGIEVTLEMLRASESQSIMPNPLDGSILVMRTTRRTAYLAPTNSKQVQLLQK